MRGGWLRAAALGAGLFLLATACTPTIGQKSNNTASQTSPSPQTSPSTATSPSSSPIGTAETPSASPAESPPASPSSATKLIITSLTFHAGEVSVGYAPVALGAAGGTQPYHWSISGGALPPGLGVSGTTVSGTPTANGNFSFTVRVDDSAGKAAGVTRSITIAAPLAVSGPCTTRCNVEIGCVTVCGHFG